MAELRQRHRSPAKELDDDKVNDNDANSTNRETSHAPENGKEKETPSKKRTYRTYDDDDDNDDEKSFLFGISLLDIIRVLMTLAIASCGISYYVTSSQSVIWGYRPWFTRWPVVMQYLKGPINLAPDQLSLYNGSDPNLPIYLAINGTIFDVSANHATYGPGGSYNFFTGKDATRAFVTGCFQDDLTSDLDGVEEMFIPVEDDADSSQERSLSGREKKLRRERELREAKGRVAAQVRHWEGFFAGHKKYFRVGKVVVVVDDEDRGEKPKMKRTLCEAAQNGRPKRRDLNLRSN